jgi:protein SCO1/2
MDSAKAKLLLLGIGVIGLGAALGTALWLRVAHVPAQWSGNLTSSGEINQYGTVPQFVLTDRSGNSVGLDQLRGKIWIADFIYTTCTDTCPMQTAMLAKLQQEYLARPELQFVSFTVDPERDTPETLRSYASKHQADPQRWYFLTGERDRIIRLIQDGFRLAVATSPVADPNGMIPHSPRFVLIDKQARIRGYYDSRELEAIRRLKNHIDILLKG